MPSLERTMDQRLVDAADSQHLEMWRAASTVRASVTEPVAQQELLECLGLLGVTRPAGR